MAEVRRISGVQDENADAHVVMTTVGVVLFWPLLFGLAATNDREDQLSSVKGEYEAVRTTMKKKRCTLPPPSQSVQSEKDKSSPEERLRPVNAN